MLYDRESHNLILFWFRWYVVWFHSFEGFPGDREDLVQTITPSLRPRLHSPLRSIERTRSWSSRQSMLQTLSLFRHSLSSRWEKRAGTSQRYEWKSLIENLTNWTLIRWQKNFPEIKREKLYRFASIAMIWRWKFYTERNRWPELDLVSTHFHQGRKKSKNRALRKNWICVPRRPHRQDI